MSYQTLLLISTGFLWFTIKHLNRATQFYTTSKAIIQLWKKSTPATYFQITLYLDSQLFNRPFNPLIYVMKSLRGNWENRYGLYSLYGHDMVRIVPVNGQDKDTIQTQYSHDTAIIRPLHSHYTATIHPLSWPFRGRLQVVSWPYRDLIMVVYEPYLISQFLLFMS